MNNKKGQLWIIFIIAFMVIVAMFFIIINIIGSQLPKTETKIQLQKDNTSTYNNKTSFTIANWNLQIFGQSKASNPLVLDFYDSKISKYDIIFVQEIRDISGTAFPKLCSMLEGYRCNISMRDGRTDSKEQIGIIYREGYDLLSLTELPDPDDVWERSPIMTVFNVSGFVFTAYNAHLKPDDVKSELNALYNVINNTGNVIVLGDFNADCNYYNTADTAFDDWNWLITDNIDTTVAKTDCAYDRIIVNDNMHNYIIKANIDFKDINTTYSDHYIIYTEVIKYT